MQQSTTKLVEAARDVLKAAGYFVDNLWHVDDIHFICEQCGLTPLSHLEAMEVFVIASKEFDGETGISWPQLERAVRAYIHRKEVLLTLQES